MNNFGDEVKRLEAAEKSKRIPPQNTPAKKSARKAPKKAAKRGPKKANSTSFKPGEGGEVATRWKPGQSGNPGGRPKKTPITDAMREMLHSLHSNQRKYPGMTYAEVLARKQLELAIEKGDMKAAMEIADRVEGKIPQGLQHTGAQGGAIQVSTLSPEENERRIAELLSKAGN